MIAGPKQVPKNLYFLLASVGSGGEWGGENPGSFHSGLLSGLWTLPWSRHQLPLGAASLVVKCAWIWESPLTTDIYLSASLGVFSQHGDNKIRIQGTSSVCEERNFWYCSAAISPATWKWQTSTKTLSSELIKWPLVRLPLAHPRGGPWKATHPPLDLSWPALVCPPLPHLTPPQCPSAGCTPGLRILWDNLLILNTLYLAGSFDRLNSSNLFSFCHLVVGWPKWASHVDALKSDWSGCGDHKGLQT